KICVPFLCALSLIVGFQSCWPAPEQDSSATIKTFPPQPLADRPVDLADFSADEVDTQISFETDRDPAGEFNALWTAEDTTTETPLYWSANAPVTLTIDLVEQSHVSGVVVYPLTRYFGVGAFDVEIVASDGTAHPLVEYRSGRTQTDIFDTPTHALSFEFSPRVAERIRIRFTRGTAGHPERVYLRAVRILGTMPHTPEIDMTGNQVPPLNEEERIDLAAFTLEQVKNRIHVSEDKRPNGRYEFPWIKNGDALPVSDQENAYWCATSPSWVSVDLGESCFVDEVRVTPFDATHGFNSLYVKIIDEHGREVDPIPPAAYVAAPIEDNETAPSEVRLRFAPVKANGVKIYLRGAEQDNPFTYVRHINVLGVPTSSVQKETPAPEN
ncbi:MAG: hypothetical protein IID08_11095, partial [Candidatus Hydrogenedentes bacterium]|nr:hypothetical protein [Candidatus Hydrogenedentota bacterium]